MSAHAAANWPSQHKATWGITAEESIGVTDEADADEILALLDDQYAQVILQQTRNNAMSAKEISEICDISISTVYRRTERLVECGLLAERRVAQPDGTHYSLYEARLDELTVRLTDDGFKITVSEKATGDLADRFTDMWEGL
nr:winged helix-turn-helix domain-containing protein [Natrarchaeobius halalkaliphilus]